MVMKMNEEQMGLGAFQFCRNFAESKEQAVVSENAYWTVINLFANKKGYWGTSIWEQV